MFSLFSHPVYANSIYFNEDFNSTTIDNIKWQAYPNDGNLNFADGYIQLSTNGYINKFPYVKSKINAIPQVGNFDIYLKIKKTNLYSFGTGIAFSTRFPENGFLADIFLNPALYQQEQFINIVLRNHDLLIVFAGSCYNIPCSYDSLQLISIPENIIPTELNFKISFTDGIYKIYLNDFNQALITSSNIVSIRPNGIWFGSPYSVGFSSWTPLNIDYIRVEGLENETKSPVIFIPGYLASFQWDDIVNNTSTHDWTRNPLEKVYDNFLATMNNLGYENNSDFVMWNYDFRRPLPEISQKFDAFLTNFLSSKPTGTKVTLIGHSFGGLVARHYLQNYGESKIQKVVTVGTPHEGVLDVYPLLAAGEIDDKLVWRKATYELMFNLMGRDFISRREAVQNFLPSATDLLPIFEDKYLKNANGNIIDSSIQNTNLINLKNTFNQANLMSIIRGNGKDTNDYYVLTDRNFLDEILNNWPDGKIVYAEHSPAGDGTVLTKSAEISGVATIELANMDHAEIISKPAAIEEILNAAGITFTNDKIANNQQSVANQAILMLLKSPATLTVKDLSTGKEIGENATDFIPDAISANDNKLIYIPTGNNKKYDVTVTGKDTGEYELNMVSVEATSSSSILSFKNQTNQGKTDVYQIQYLKQGNLLDLTDTEIKNPYFSLKTSFIDLKNYISTSSADLNTKTEISNTISDLIGNTDLIKSLFEDKNDVNNSIREIQKTLKETFALRNMFNDLEEQEIISSRSKTLKALENEKQIFEIITNTAFPVSSVRSNNYLTALSIMFQKTSDKLADKNAESGLNEFNVDSFKVASDSAELAKKEQESYLFGRSYFSSEIARFLLIEASN